MNTLLGIIEKDILSYFNSKKHTTSYVPSRVCHRLLHEVLFPFQIYLLSQAEGDTAGVRTESEILEGYLMQLLPLCIRIVSSVQSIISSNPSVQPIILTSLTATPVDVLLPYLLSILYMGQYSLLIAANLRTDLMELTPAWCSLMLLCGVDVVKKGRNNE